jgi:hypothetical protein
MSILDCKFTFADSEIYGPKGIESGVDYVFKVENLGDTVLENIGFYLHAATSIGDVDNPADYPRETDYQDLLTWGSQTKLGIEITGGLKISYTDRSGDPQVAYFSRDSGANRSTRILIEDIGVDAQAEFTLRLETPPGVVSRRFFITLVLE